MNKIKDVYDISKSEWEKMREEREREMWKEYNKREE
jgi:hypothetical protein